MIMQIFTQYTYAWRNVEKILNLLFDTFHHAKLFLLKSAYVTCHFCRGSCTYLNDIKFVQWTNEVIFRLL